jgi:hypothetical protein
MVTAEKFIVQNSALFTLPIPCLHFVYDFLFDISFAEPEPQEAAPIWWGLGGTVKRNGPHFGSEGSGSDPFVLRV